MIKEWILNLEILFYLLMNKGDEFEYLDKSAVYLALT
jgi:hypothetical protein